MKPVNAKYERLKHKIGMMGELQQNNLGFRTNELGE